MKIEPAVKAAVQAITSQPGFKMETGKTMRGEAYVQLISPPAGRGVQRQKYLVVAEELSDVFHALAELTKS